MIAYVAPVVEEISDERCVIRIPHNLRNSNHLIGGIYFGALCVGADIAGGLIAFRHLQRSGKKFSLAFKDFKAEFFKRAEGDALFTCRDGRMIQELAEKALANPGLRLNETVQVVAQVPSRLGDELIAKFELTLSLKSI